VLDASGSGGPAGGELTSPLPTTCQQPPHAQGRVRGPSCRSSPRTTDSPRDKPVAADDDEINVAEGDDQHAERDGDESGAVRLPNWAGAVSVACGPAPTATKSNILVRAQTRLGEGEVHRAARTAESTRMPDKPGLQKKGRRGNWPAVQTYDQTRRQKTSYRASDVMAQHRRVWPVALRRNRPHGGSGGNQKRKQADRHKCLPGSVVQ